MLDRNTANCNDISTVWERYTVSMVVNTNHFPFSPICVSVRCFLKPNLPPTYSFFQRLMSGYRRIPSISPRLSLSTICILMVGIMPLSNRIPVHRGPVSIISLSKCYPSYSNEVLCEALNAFNLQLTELWTSCI